MAAISFLAGATTVNNLAGSGLGFFGGSFGQSVQINQLGFEDFEENAFKETCVWQSVLGKL